MDKREIRISKFDNRKNKYSIVDNEIEKLSITTSILLTDDEALDLANAIYAYLMNKEKDDDNG